MLNSETTQVVTQGGAATLAVAILREAAIRMIPYSFAAVPLLVLDCIYGARAARIRDEHVTLSKGIRMTLNKVFSYVCWLILAPTLAIAFEKEWIEWFVLACVFGNELVSVVGNYLETKGIKLSFVAFYRWIIKQITAKVGAEMTAEEAQEILSGDAKPRDEKGRFIKKIEEVAEQEELLEQ